MWTVCLFVSILSSQIPFLPSLGCANDFLCSNIAVQSVFLALYNKTPTHLIIHNYACIYLIYIVFYRWYECGIEGVLISQGEKPFIVLLERFIIGLCRSQDNNSFT